MSEVLESTSGSDEIGGSLIVQNSVRVAWPRAGFLVSITLSCLEKHKIACLHLNGGIFNLLNSACACLGSCKMLFRELGGKMASVLWGRGTVAVPFHGQSSLLLA